MTKQGRRSGSNSLTLVTAAVAVLVLVGAGFGVGALLKGRVPSVVPVGAKKGTSTSASTKPTVATTLSADPTPPRPVPVSNPATDQVVPVLMYHHVMPQPNNSIAITPATFDKQMAWLKENGYHPITTQQMTEFELTGKRLPGKPVYITFDDGRMNQLTYAVPILKKYGFTATFFVVKKWVVTKSSSFMHEDELKALVADGFDVQSHTGNHVKMIAAKSGGKTESYASMKAKLWPVTYGFRVWLSQLTGKPVTAVAYPGGYEDSYSPRLMHEAGYTTAYTTNDGVNRYGRPSPLMLKRYNAGARGLSFASFKAMFRESEKAAK